MVKGPRDLGGSRGQAKYILSKSNTRPLESPLPAPVPTEGGAGKDKVKVEFGFSQPQPKPQPLFSYTLIFEPNPILHFHLFVFCHGHIKPNQMGTQFLIGVGV